MSSTLRSKAIETFEDLLQNKDIEIGIREFSSYANFIEESTDPLFMVSRFIMRRMQTKLIQYIMDAVSINQQRPA
jgi:hypothetical protein